MIRRGFIFKAQYRATQAKPRMFFLIGFPPRALEKKVQSGESHIRPTRRDLTSFSGLTFHTSSSKCFVLG